MPDCVTLLTLSCISLQTKATSDQANYAMSFTINHQEVALSMSYKVLKYMV